MTKHRQALFVLECVHFVGGVMIDYVVHVHFHAVHFGANGIASQALRNALSNFESRYGVFKLLYASVGKSDVYHVSFLLFVFEIMFLVTTI